MKSLRVSLNLFLRYQSCCCFSSEEAEVLTQLIFDCKGGPDHYCLGYWK